MLCIIPSSYAIFWFTMRFNAVISCFALALVLASLLSSSSVHASSPDLEGFEEPDVVPVEPPIKTHASGAGAKDFAEDPAQKAKDDANYGFSQEKEIPIRAKLKLPVAEELNFFKKYIIEILSSCLILICAVTVFMGDRSNRALAEAWAREFAAKGRVFDKNFSSISATSTIPLMRESGNLYKFYATGRRYCQGLLAELQLVPRQDALSMFTNLISPAEDLVRIDVYMTEDAMPPIVLAIATAKCARAMQRDSKDIIRFTKRITVGKEMFPSWPGDRLWVLAEHSSVFQDLVSDPKLQQLLSFTGANADSMKFFRSMHFTSENSEASHKRVLRFVFKLPPPDQMTALSRLMDLVPVFIDIVGTYKLPVELKKRALEARVKQDEDDEDLKKKRLDAIQQKKVEKAQEEKARVQRMNPEARQKYEDKMQRQNVKKAMKGKVTRM